MASPQRSRGVAREGVGGFSQCWFPVALSEQVVRGQVLGTSFLDGRVVVYRLTDGQVRVHSAYCRHLGADLSLADVEGDELVCAYHRWRYGADGVCVDIPAADDVPPQARLFAFPSVERWGLVWAFNGTEPSYDVPGWTDIEDSKLVSRATQTDLLPVDPCVLLSNSMDFQHLRELHGMRIAVDPMDIDMSGPAFSYEVDGDVPEFGEMHHHVSVFGTNVIALRMTQGEDMELRAMYAGKPVAGSTQGFSVSACRRVDGNDPEAEARTEQLLGSGEALARTLEQEDNPIMKTIRFKEDVLVKADQPLARYFRYVRNFPRAHPSDGLIN